MWKESLLYWSLIYLVLQNGSSVLRNHTPVSRKQFVNDQMSEKRVKVIKTNDYIKWTFVQRCEMILPRSGAVLWSDTYWPLHSPRICKKYLTCKLLINIFMKAQPKRVSIPLLVISVGSDSEMHTNCHNPINTSFWRKTQILRKGKWSRLHN